MLFPSPPLQSAANFSKHVLNKQLSRSLCFNFMHYVQKKITCFQHGYQEYQQILMKIIDVI